MLAGTRLEERRFAVVRFDVVGEPWHERYLLARLEPEPWWLILTPDGD